MLRCCSLKTSLVAQAVKISTYSVGDLALISGWGRSPGEGNGIQMYRTDFWTLWEKARVGCFERTASKHVYYLGWNRSPAQLGCMREALEPGALGRPRGIGWRGRWVGGSGWGTHVNPWLFHFNVWQNPPQIKKIKKKKKNLPACAGDIRDTGSIPGLERSPRRGHDNPLKYSCLENSTDRGSWQATVHRVAKSWTQL